MKMKMKKETQEIERLRGVPAKVWRGLARFAEMFGNGDDGPVDMEVFRIGDYGEKGEYTTADLDELIARYNTELYEAPVVIDHKREGDSHGWVSKIWRVGETLWARVRGLSDELQGKIETGAMRYRSIEVMPNFEGMGLDYFYGLSFLGAKAPAVKGLVDVKLAEGTVELMTFSGDFTTETQRHGEERREKGEVRKNENAEAQRRREDKERRMKEEGEEMTKEMANEATQAVKDGAVKEFKDSDEWKELQEKAKKAEAGDAAVKKMGELERAGREEKVDARLKALSDAGKILPWQAPVVRATVLALMATESKEQIEFDDGEKKEKVDLGEALLRTFERQGEIVPFSEIAAREKGSERPSGPQPVEGKNVKPENVDLDRKVRAFMAENKDVSYRQALRMVGS